MPVAQLIGAGERSPQVVMTYSGSITGASTTGTLWPDENVSRRVLPYAGSIYALGVGFGGTITSGTLTVMPQINGTPVAGFKAVTTTANAKGVYNTQEARLTNFPAGSTLEILVIPASASPTTLAMVCDVYLLLESVNL